MTQKKVLLVLLLFIMTGAASMNVGTVHSPVQKKPFEADSSTLALWHFDEGSGQVVADSSSHANNGTLGPTSSVESNDPSWATGFTGAVGDYAVSFDEWYDYVNIPDNVDGSLDLQLLDQFTIEFWTYLRQISRDEHGSGDDWNRFLQKAYLYFGPPDICGYGIYQCERIPSFSAWVFDYGTEENWQVGCSPPPLNDWVRIRLVYDGNFSRIYFNDVMQSQQFVGRFNFTDTTSPLTIGKWPGQDWWWVDAIDGIIDEVRLSSCARDVLGVGGFYVPVDKIGLIVPYAGLASTLLITAAVTAVFVKRTKRRSMKQ